MINNFCNLLNSFGFDIVPVENRTRKSLRENIASNKTIRGAFSKLSDDDKKSVVDSLNSTQKLFRDIFGFSDFKEWTVDDLDGSYVNVTTSGDAEPEKKESKCDEKECACKDKKEEKQNIKTSLADMLRSEIDRGTRDDELSAAICEKVVEKLNDKKNHPYKLHPAVGDVPAMASVDVRLLQDKPSELVNNSHVCHLVRERLINEVGCKDVYITDPEPNVMNGVNIRIEMVL